ncbi:uncharacterized protein LOC130818404 [Amaranthus tricolor]|uniref:uncharacterized protein LOC130818404 n=1 Tax=Amaranthus tricolor TaxID=29722 RepID=UPI00258A4036|nr:uncharacterized protein LOC130818404 [Amaranthus tricolor]
MAYKNLMLYTTNPALLCKFFPTTLSGTTLIWYTSLPIGSIHTFAQLEAMFGKLSPPTLRSSKRPFWKWQTWMSQVKTYADVMRQCQSFVTASNICQAHDSKKQKHDKQDQGQYHSSKAYRDHEYSSRERGYPTRHQGPSSKMGYELLIPSPSTIPSDRRNYNLWCDYHKGRGHTLSQCRELKRILHQLAEEGKLERFLNRKEYGSRSDNERKCNTPKFPTP